MADNQNRGKGKKNKSDPKMGACAPIKIIIIGSVSQDMTCNLVAYVGF